MAGEMAFLDFNMLRQGWVGNGGSNGVAENAALVVDQEPSSVVPAASWDPFDAIWMGVGNGMTAGDVDGVMVINHNWPRKTSTRWLVGTYANQSDWGAFSPHQPLERLYPTSLEASSGFVAGTYTEVDDSPWAPGTDKMEAGGGTPWARFGFATPTNPLAADVAGGGETQAFVVQVYNGSVIGTANPVGTVTIKLYEAGSLVATLLNAESVYEGGGIFAGYWNRSQLSDTTGADAELYVETTGGHHIYAAEWIVCGATDSGWVQIDVPESPSSWPPSLGPNAALLEPVQNEFRLFDTPLTSKGEVFVAVLAPTGGASVAPEIGTLAAGKLYRPPINFAEGATIGVVDASQIGQTLGGQDVITSRNRKRIVTLTLDMVTVEAFAQFFERFDWRKGAAGTFGISMFPEHDTLRRLTTFWCRAGKEEESRWSIKRAAASGDTEVIRFTKTFVFLEKL